VGVVVRFASFQKLEFADMNNNSPRKISDWSVIDLERGLESNLEKGKLYIQWKGLPLIDSIAIILYRYVSYGGATLEEMKKKARSPSTEGWNVPNVFLSCSDQTVVNNYDNYDDNDDDSGHCDCVGQNRNFQRSTSGLI